MTSSDRQARSVGVVTVGRSDYSHYRPVLKCISGDADLRLRLFVGGTHLLARYGFTIDNITSDGYAAAATVPVEYLDDTPLGIARAMASATHGFAAAFADVAPDLLVVLGDRFEMHAAAVAAVPFGIPVAHIHGGELTLGAFDDTLRHSISKLSHFHFVAMPEFGRRLMQMGEEPWRVVVSGAPTLDNLANASLPDRAELERRLRIDLSTPPALVVFHPVTLEHQDVGTQIDELLSAVDSFGGPVVFSGTNADTGNRTIHDRVSRFVADHDRAHAIESFGPDAFFAMMREARVMVGNSSSGIIEAASFRAPVVNVGTRQDGRPRPANVIDAPCERSAILTALRRADNPEFRARLADLVNPYGSGHASAAIVDALKRAPLGDKALRKQFCDLPQ